MIKNNEQEYINIVGKTTYHNDLKTFGIRTDDLRRHMYVIGKTGMGKTVFLENMIVQDIINGRGCCYVDPHGDTAERLLTVIPKERINDVIYFNPSDLEFPISFNVLEKVDPQYRHLVASGLVAVFKKLWADSWGPRLEYILRYTILALLDSPDSTLLGINRMLVDKAYNKKVVDRVTDPVVRSFWIDEFTKWNDRVLAEVISPIQNKVGAFLSTTLIRNIVGQTKSTIDLRKIMDENKILILNLSKGRIGEDSSNLLGAMVITKIQLAAMSRVDVPEEDREDFILYVDEFQNFVSDAFADILSEARKYRLSLIIAHQYIEQLGEVVAPAVFGNVGSIVNFRVGAADAEFLVKEYEPFLTKEDLVALPKYQFYTKLMINGISSDPFSAIGLPPIVEKYANDNEEKIIASSRERYAESRDMVQEKIKKWAETVHDAGEVKPEEKKDFAPKDVKVNCDFCGEEFMINFQPDGIRPVLCDVHRPLYQKGVLGQVKTKYPRAQRQRGGPQRGRQGGEKGSFQRGRAERGVKREAPQPSTTEKPSEKQERAPSLKERVKTTAAPKFTEKDKDKKESPPKAPARRQGGYQPPAEKKEKVTARTTKPSTDFVQMVSSAKKTATTPIPVSSQGGQKVSKSEVPPSHKASADKEREEVIVPKKDVNLLKSSNDTSKKGTVKENEVIEIKK